MLAQGLLVVVVLVGPREWRPGSPRRVLGQFVALNVLAIMVFLPWLPTAWDQVTAWPRTGTPFSVRMTNFGAFVDIGVHQDGLVHISELSDRFVRHPSEVVRVQQAVKVTVLAVDTERRRISLSMKTESASPPERAPLSTQAEESSARSDISKKKKKPPIQKPGPFHNPFRDLLGDGSHS